MKRERIFVDTIVLVSIFIFPWWIPAVISIVAAVLLRNFLEIIALAAVYDFVYASSMGVFGGLQFPATIAACIVYIALSVLKKYTLIDAE